MVVGALSVVYGTSHVALIKDIQALQKVDKADRPFTKNNLIQIQASVSPLRNTSGFPWPEVYKKKGDDDILDWLQAIFGYEVDSVCDDVLSVLARQFVVAAILDLGIGFGTVTHCNVILLHTNVAGFACYD
ncbi:hypothetical protein E3N88_16453 [Mikania micrantha]|uniref:Uncharacterized protein n=1 Tax=Mikania micrantha TaxID=192012 RepID=A0A5N6P0I5_9ASTR|nr:hypothetical protein E3N88_16453 [Mikania micrantha]